MPELNIIRKREEIDPQKYIIADYYLAGPHVEGGLIIAATAVALGQSIGNPTVRNAWETDELVEKHCALIINPNEDPDTATDAMKIVAGNISIAYPLANINFETDGISQLLCMVMGGQMDVADVKQCVLHDLHFPDSVANEFYNPGVGLSGMRKLTGRTDRPFVGGIVKPKIGMDVKTLKENVKEMITAGIDFIKEDEILGDPASCPLKDRVEAICDLLEELGKPIVYCFCINGDPHQILEKAKIVNDRYKYYSSYKIGVHINIWSGLGAYNSIRKTFPHLFIHYQKSGDKTITYKFNSYHIEWKVLCKLAALCGVDSIHFGMWGGYYNGAGPAIFHHDFDEKDKTQFINDLKALTDKNVIPILSCGMHPGLVDSIRSQFGDDMILNVGGAIHGHPAGTYHGVKAMRQAVDETGGEEFLHAIQKWGYTKP